MKNSESMIYQRKVPYIISIGTLEGKIFSGIYMDDTIY